MRQIPIFILILISFLISGQCLAEKKDSPVSVEGATTANTAEAKQLFDNEALFVDVRLANRYENSRIPGAIHTDMKEGFTSEFLEKEAAKDEPVVFYCGGIKCSKSAKAVKRVLGWGFTKVYYYREGFPGWQKAGYPVE